MRISLVIASIRHSAVLKPRPASFQRDVFHASGPCQRRRPVDVHCRNVRNFSWYNGLDCVGGVSQVFWQLMGFRGGIHTSWLMQFLFTVQVLRFGST